MTKYGNVPDERIKQILDEYEKCGRNIRALSRRTGMPRSTLWDWLQKAKVRGILPTVEQPSGIDYLKERLKQAELAVTKAKDHALSEKLVKDIILQLSEKSLSSAVPDWTLNTKKSSNSSPGIPTLFASDWHAGEMVDPTQIGGVNEYNVKILHARAAAMIENTIDLLTNHMVNPNYPGIVFALGGDMVSGDIHEDLLATNEIEIMETVVELFGILTWCIHTLADQFGAVFVPCVSGNHGRSTQKMRAKGRNYTSFDWLLYCFLAKRFEADDRVTFMIPNGPDALYRIYTHKYLLTHGDQFRGGDGMIGALGPIIRGDHKKRSRNAQIDMEYDTMIMGHWHQLMMLERVIVNGSLKGYDEYANSNNFGFEVPRQALWITHPQHGITFSMPVYVDPKRKEDIKTAWVSWQS